MQKMLAGSLLMLALTLSAQEKLPREEALKYAFVTALNLNDLLGTPIPTDPDLKRPIVVRDGDYGGLALPESRFSAESIAKIGTKPVPVGQLWMHKLVPMNDDQPVSREKLRMVHLKAGTMEGDACSLALALRKADDGSLELLVYSKGAEPVLRAAAKTVSNHSENPLDFTAERKENGGLITVTIAGKCTASFMVTDPERF